MLRTTNVRHGRIDTVKTRFVEQGIFEKWTRRAVPQIGDVILTREAPFGEVGMIRKEERVFLGQRLMMYRADSSVCDPRFLLYAMLGPEVQSELRSLGSGATVEHLRVPDCESISIPCPDISTQRKIGHILGTLDDLIENNRRRVELLDQMAEAIYREWFVHFRYPGHEGVTMVDSPVGPIPEGWEAVPLAQLIEFHIGGGWGQNELDAIHSMTARVIRGTDIPKARIGDVSSCQARFHTPSNLSSRELRPGDIVLEVSGGGKTEPVGRPLLVTSPLLEELAAPTMCASFCKLLRPNPERATGTFLLLHLDEIREVGVMERYQVQSTGIKNLRFVPFIEGDLVPTPQLGLLCEFEDVVNPLFGQIVVLGRSSKRLAEIRDLLLPKLVTGQIDVSALDLDPLVEAAG